jgi:hypothetical protein
MNGRVQKLPSESSDSGIVLITNKQGAFTILSPDFEDLLRRCPASNMPDLAAPSEEQSLTLHVNLTMSIYNNHFHMRWRKNVLCVARA